MTSTSKREATGLPNTPELLSGHVTLEVECLDRLYLNGYIGKLSPSGGLVTFLREAGRSRRHRGGAEKSTGLQRKEDRSASRSHAGEGGVRA